MEAYETLMGTLNNRTVEMTSDAGVGHQVGLNYGRVMYKV